MRRRRKNPLTTGEWALIGLGTAAAIGVGYVLYKNSQSAALAQVNAASGQMTLPGGSGAPSASQVDQSAYLNQTQFQYAQGGSALPDTETPTLTGG